MTPAYINHWPLLVNDLQLYDQAEVANCAFLEQRLNLVDGGFGYTGP